MNLLSYPYEQRLPNFIPNADLFIQNIKNLINDNYFNPHRLDGYTIDEIFNPHTLIIVPVDVPLVAGVGGAMIRSRPNPPPVQAPFGPMPDNDWYLYNDQDLIDIVNRQITNTITIPNIPIPPEFPIAPNLPTDITFNSPPDFWIHKSNLLHYILLSYYLIYDPLKLNEIEKKKNINNNYHHIWQNNWTEIFKNNIGNYVVIYEMWVDLNAKLSSTNLECIIPFNLIILISALYNYGRNKCDNKQQSIINSFKPHLLDNIITISVPYNELNNKIKWLLLLLCDNINLHFLQTYIMNNGIRFNDINDFNNNFFTIIYIYQICIEI
jgi:hypothetical protein